MMWNANRSDANKSWKATEGRVCPPMMDLIHWFPAEQGALFQAICLGGSFILRHICYNLPTLFFLGFSTIFDLQLIFGELSRVSHFSTQLTNPKYTSGEKKKRLPESFPANASLRCSPTSPAPVPIWDGDRLNQARTLPQDTKKTYENRSTLSMHIYIHRRTEFLKLKFKHSWNRH